MRSRIKSLLYALRGLKTIFIQEKNFQIQTVIALVTVILMFVFPLTYLERILLVLVIGLVLLLEIANTVLEYTFDIFHPRVHPAVGVVKDIMAGAVLIGALMAGIIGIFIFLPYVWPLLEVWI